MHRGAAPPGISRVALSYGFPLFHLADEPQNTDVDNESTISYLDVSSLLQGQVSTVKFLEFTF